MFRSTSTFDRFDRAETNEEAWAAALSFARGGLSRWQPALHLVGPSAAGKSHLLHAICNRLRAKGEEARARYAPAFEVVQALVGEPARRRPLDEVLDVDLLLVDDSQYLASRPGTWSEVRWLLRERASAGRRTVMAWSTDEGVEAFLAGPDAPDGDVVRLAWR